MPSLSRLLILRSLLRQRPRNSNNSYGQNNVNTNSSSPSPSPPHHSPANPNPNNPRPKTSSDGPPGKQPPPPPPPPPPSWLGHPFRVLANTLKLVALAHLVWEYGVSVAPASGPSMLPTFEVLGEWLVISKPHRFGRGVSIGDVVAYSIPINDEVGVKRVLGLPGDYVLMDGSGAAGGGGGLERETGAAAAAANMIQVPQGHCWIVGDNLIASRDSRYFGPVPLALIRGKVIATVRPFSEFRRITNPLQRPDESHET